MTPDHRNEEPRTASPNARPASASFPSPAARLSVQGLSRRFGPVTAVEGVDLCLSGGECLSLFGPNGAGKTTLLKMLALLVRPSAGRIWLEGEEIRTSADREAGRSRMGFLSHQPLLYGHLSPSENLQFYGRLYGVPRLRERVEEVLADVDLSDRAEDPVRRFSRGMLQRAAIARTLLHDPDIVFLDEPFSGLDRAGARGLADILRRMKEEGRALVLATHDLDRGLNLGSGVVILHRGSVRYARPRSKVDASDFAEVYESCTGGLR